MVMIGHDDDSSDDSDDSDVHVGMPTVQIGHVLKLLMAQCFVSHVVQGFVN